MILLEKNYCSGSVWLCGLQTGFPGIFTTAPHLALTFIDSATEDKRWKVGMPIGSVGPDREGL